MKHDCTECSKCGTDRCKNPGECVKSGYKYFENPHNDRSKFCELCGERLTVAYSKKPSPECWGKALRCPVCGIVGDLDIQYKSRVRKAQKSPA